MSSMAIPCYRASDIRRAITMTEMIGVMRSAFIAISSGDAVVPPRSRIDVGPTDGVALFMPSYLPASEALGVKTVTLFRNNPDLGLPTIHGLMLLFDGATGGPMAILEGDSLTALRTGAASGVATDLLARPDAHVVAVIGTGPQAEAQLRAVCAVRRITRALVSGRDGAKSARFALRMSDALGIEVAAVDTHAAVRHADIVCTATSSREPLFVHGTVAPGTHLNAIGSYKPDRQEIPGETVAGSVLFVDSLEAALLEAGDLIIPLEERLISRDSIRGEIGQLLQGSVKGRTEPRELTLFKSVGNALQDLTAAVEIHSRLREDATIQRITL